MSYSTTVSSHECLLSKQVIFVPQNVIKFLRTSERHINIGNIRVYLTIATYVSPWKSTALNTCIEWRFIRQSCTEMSTTVEEKRVNVKRIYADNFPLKSHVILGAHAKKILKKVFGYFCHFSCLYIAYWDPLKILCWTFILCSFMKTRKQLHFELKFDKIKGHFTLRNRCESALISSKIRCINHWITSRK